MDTVFTLIEKERKRQQETLMLIPSENYQSREVIKAQDLVLNNKYSEGYAGRRYYQGNAVIDEIEMLAIDRSKKAFGALFANVQSYSGSPANAAILMALLNPGETVMGMKLAAGGHLTHGHPDITFSGKFFRSAQYDVNADGWIDYEEVEKLAKKENPKVIMAGTTAYPRMLDWGRFRAIADAVGAYLVADISHIAGLVIAGVHPSPVGVADVVMTTTHKTLGGPRGSVILSNDEELAKKIDKAVFPGLQGGPHNATTAGIAVAMQKTQDPTFTIQMQQVVKNAKVLAEEMVRLGVPLVTGGTDNHLMVADVRGFDMLGKEAAIKLEEAGMIVNANAIAHDPNPPFKPSGIRLGTPAVTTRGMKEVEMKQIAQWMHTVLIGTDVRKIAEEVKILSERFPIWE